jgi:hypothetical protein
MAGGIYIQYLTNYLLPFSHMVANVLDPSAGYLGDMNQALLACIFVYGDESTEVHHLSDGADHKRSGLWPALTLH